jgi:two-component system LytT family response regulator
MKAIIIEDMPAALQALRAEIKTHCPDIEIIGTADSVVSGAKLLRQTKPDLVFLDILLGDGTGFDLLEIFPNLQSGIIFVTASDEHAVRAFRFAAIDYLLKPVEPEQLKAAVARAKTQANQDKSNRLELLRETIRQPNTLPERITLHTLEKIHIVRISEIVRCESDGNNTRFILADGSKAFVTRTLKHFERMLTDHHFLRIHQSHLVNFRCIKEFIKKDGGYLLLTNGEQVPVASRKRAEVIERLG